MSIMLLGGMDRLVEHYENEAKKMGVKLKVYTKGAKNVTKKIGKVDAVLIFTDKIAHPVKHEVVSYAKTKGIPCFMAHSCGLCTLRKCLEQLKKLYEKGGLA
ncbi:DUF2325 domain-containing protein [Thermodesulfovibrio hydrogeniphilus]